jgi:hypothetical protein
MLREGESGAAVPTGNGTMDAVQYAEAVLAEGMGFRFA